MATVHKLVKIEEQTQNRQGLQWYIECSCGFQARVGTEQAAKSQYDNHLMYHGCEAYFSKLVDGVEEKESETTTVQAPLTPEGSGWKPTGVK